MSFATTLALIIFAVWVLGSLVAAALFLFRFFREETRIREDFDREKREIDRDWRRG